MKWRYLFVYLCYRILQSSGVLLSLVYSCWAYISLCYAVCVTVGMMRSVVYTKTNLVIYEIPSVIEGIFLFN